MLDAADHLGGMVAVFLSIALISVLGPKAATFAGLGAAIVGGVLAIFSSVSFAGDGADHRNATTTSCCDSSLKHDAAGIALVLAFSVSLSVALEHGERETSLLDKSTSLRSLPLALGTRTGWAHIAQPFPHLEKLNADGTVAILRATKGAVRVRGYEGPVSLWMDLDSQGMIVDARMGPNRETPSYVWGMDDWVKQLRGRRASTLTLGDGLDAMTGATVTSRALVESAHKTGGWAEEVMARRRALAEANHNGQQEENAGAIQKSNETSSAPQESSVNDSPHTENLSSISVPKQEASGPRLHRRDDKPYDHQKLIDLETLNRQIGEGNLSKHEAQFYLSVENQATRPAGDADP